MEVSVYERIGGEASVRDIVVYFYSLVVVDPELMPYFARADMGSLQRHQTRFLSQLLGGPPAGGRSMAEAHKDLGITDAAYDRVMGHLGTALRQLQVPEEHIAVLREKVEAFRAEIVER